MIIKKIMPKSSVARKRVAAYCRVSTLREDQVESFETQRRYYADLIESHPEWEMVKIYADRHSATKAENRPGFQEMAADAQARKLDIFLALRASTPCLWSIYFALHSSNTFQGSIFCTSSA